ncbi:MAG: ATP-binding cassette domain-containing protein [Gammaproteobacteria bacterium]|nr:ATP-binding cassette domain-containing protein [Gammaproteobacteria bacterium]MCW8923988.1 ATP-binding cassette domain-containing protein [Gammaproteobacteria bacterium]
MEGTALIHCEQLSIDSDEHLTTERKLNLTASAGSVVSIIGPNHDDNARCLHAIGGISNTKSGQLYLAGRENMQFEKKDWVQARCQFAYVHANTTILSAANALQNLMLPAMYHKTGAADELMVKAQQLLKDIRAGDNLEQLPAFLEKEQRFKIAVARALMINPKALLIDSPFTSLELTSIKPFKQFLLNRVRDHNLLLILVTHDSKFALKHSDQIIYVSENRILQFDQNHRIQDCDDPEVCEYLAI